MSEHVFTTLLQASEELGSSLTFILRIAFSFSHYYFYLSVKPVMELHLE